LGTWTQRTLVGPVPVCTLFTLLCALHLCKWM
jgi:hypothetical protein